MQILSYQKSCGLDDTSFILSAKASVKNILNFGKLGLIQDFLVVLQVNL